MANNCMNFININGSVNEIQKFSKLLEIGENVKKIYGKDITYSRIELVSAIKSLSIEQENSLAYILNNSKLMSKLAGY